MAKQATELAIGMMQGKTPSQSVTLLDTQLVTKENAATAEGWDAAR